MDFTADMEFWLLVIGGAVIIGIIGFAIASSSSNKRRRRVRERNTTITTPGDLFNGLSGEENGKPAKNSRGGRGKGRKEPIVNSLDSHDSASEGEAPADVDLGENEGAGDATQSESGQSGQSGQGSLINDREEDLAARPEIELPGRSQTASADIRHDAQVLVVYVMARGQGEFRCSGVNRVLTRSGCMLDERGIFHLKDDDQRDVFSVVNALEPATFDPDRIEVDNTRGLVFFLETRGQGDKRRFDSMLSIARKLALELDGELLDDKREPLSSVRELTYKVDLAD